MSLGKNTPRTCHRIWQMDLNLHLIHLTFPETSSEMVSLHSCQEGEHREKTEVCSTNIWKLISNGFVFQHHTDPKHTAIAEKSHFDQKWSQGSQHPKKCNKPRQTWWHFHASQHTLLYYLSHGCCSNTSWLQLPSCQPHVHNNNNYRQQAPLFMPARRDCRCCAGEMNSPAQHHRPCPITKSAKYPSRSRKNYFWRLLRKILPKRV